MRVDLFELIEGVFRGVVYFFYNLFETLFQLIRRPLRGPLRLHQMNRSPKLRQIGGVTFLFVAMFGFFAVFLAAYSLMQYDLPEDMAAAGLLFEEIWRTMSSALMGESELTGYSLYPIVTAALVSTVILDSLIRVTARILSPRRRGRRELAIAAAEFAMFWPILLIIVLSLFVATNSALQGVLALSPGWSPPGWAVVPVLAGILLAVVPAALLLASGVRARRLLRGRAGDRSNGPSGANRTAALLTLPVLALMFLAGIVPGAAVGTEILLRRTPPNDPIGLETPKLVRLDCRLGETPARVEAAVWNSLDKPVAPAGGYSLVISKDLDDENFTDVRFLDAVAERDPDSVTNTLAPHEVRELRLVVPEYRRQPGDEEKQCGLMIPGQGYEPGDSVHFPIKDNAD